MLNNIKDPKETIFFGLTYLLLVGSFFYNIFIINKIFTKESNQYEINKELLNILNKYVDNQLPPINKINSVEYNKNLEGLENSTLKIRPINLNKIKEDKKNQNGNQNSSIKPNNYMEELKMVLNKREKLVRSID